MNKTEVVARLCDATPAGRLAHGEVEHIVDMMADWGWITLDDAVRTDNAQIEGAETEPDPAPADNNEPLFESPDDVGEVETESEHRELVTPRVHRTKVKTKTKAKPARRSHR